MLSRRQFLIHECKAYGVTIYYTTKQAYGLQAQQILYGDYDGLIAC